MDLSFPDCLLHAAVRLVHVHAALEPAFRLIFLKLRIEGLDLFPFQVPKLQAGEAGRIEKEGILSRCEQFRMPRCLFSPLRTD